MRNSFIEILTELAEQDKLIYLLTGDLGFSVFENFAKKNNDRFINCGIAEQNMMGFAAGLALSGKKPIVYSIVPFVTMRCFEQIRDDVCLQNLNVKIVGVGAGFSYGQLGGTHYAIDDIAIMRVLPNIKIFSPADSFEAKAAVRAMMNFNGPAYLRLGKGREPLIHNKELNLIPGKCILLKDGSDITIIGTGAITKNALIAAETIEKEMHISCRVLSMLTIKPLDVEAIINAAKNTKAIFTVEEHSVVGGLGEATASVIAQSQYKPFFKIIGINEGLASIVGDQDYLRNICDLSTEKIKIQIKKELDRI